MTLVKMTKEESSIKKEIAYAENLCRELEKQVTELETKLDQGKTKLENSRNKKAILVELKEVQKLLKKYTDQLDHLRTHDSIALRLIMGLSLIIFVLWMIVVLTSNWGKSSSDIETDGLI